jgi:hypothetical protein
MRKIAAAVLMVGGLAVAGQASAHDGAAVVGALLGGAVIGAVVGTRCRLSCIRHRPTRPCIRRRLMCRLMRPRINRHLCMQGRRRDIAMTSIKGAMLLAARRRLARTAMHRRRNRVGE